MRKSERRSEAETPPLRGGMRDSEGKDVARASMSSATGAANRAFTLIELLIVIVVIMVLVGLLMPTMFGTKKQAKEQQARGEITALKAAIMNYKFTNREWPVAANMHGRDRLFCGERFNSRVHTVEDNHAAVLEALTNDVPPHLDNSDFSIKDDKILDPWQTPYVIAFDTDYDGDVWVPDLEKKNEWTNSVQGVEIWSYGPDRKSSFPDDGQPQDWQTDDVRSWKE